MTGSIRTPAVRWRCVACLAAMLAVLTGLAPAEAQQAVRFTATLDGRDAERIDSNRPLELTSGRPLEVMIAVTNMGSRELLVRSVRLESKVVGLTFFAYETRLDLRVAPGSTEQRRFPFELLDLSEQATGLLPGRLALLDEDRDELAVRRVAAEVDGSMLSIYGVFALLVFAITGLLVAALIVRLAARRMSPNRWKRGIRFGTAGVGIGLTLTFSLSALRLLLPESSRWLPLVLVCGGVLFVIGYLTPTPYDESTDDDEQHEVGVTGGER